MVYIKSLLVGAAALSASAAALPASPTRGNAQSPAKVDVGVHTGTVARMVARHEREGSPLPKLQANVHHKDKASGHTGGLSATARKEEKEAHGKRVWRGRLGPRGPWRDDYDDSLIDVNLGADGYRPEPVRPTGDLLDVNVKRHERGNIVVVENDRDRYGEEFRHDEYRHDVQAVENIHQHIHERHSHHHDGEVVQIEDGRHREHLGGYRETEIKEGGRHDHLPIEVDAHGHSFEYKRHENDVVVEHEGGDRHRHDGHHGHDRHDGFRTETTDVNVKGHNNNVVVNSKRDLIDVESGIRHSHHNHGHDNVVIVANGHRNKEGMAIVNNNRRKLGGLGRAFLKKARNHNEYMEQTTVVDTGRHGNQVIVDSEAGRHAHHEGDSTVIVDNHKRHESDRIVVLGDERHYRDTDMYYNNRGERFGRPIFFDGHDYDSNRVRVIQQYSPGYEPLYEHVPVVPSRGRYYNWKRHERVEDPSEIGRLEGLDYDRYDDEGRHHCVDGRCGGGVHDQQNVNIVNNNVYKRDTADDMGGAPGYIDVTSPVFNSTVAQRIASLVLSTSNETDTNSTFVLNASNNIRTQVYLVPINSNATSVSAASVDDTTPDGPIEVNLKLPIFVAALASVQPYCATFDPSPASPAPLTVKLCSNETTTHESQRFLYNPSTGVIHPDWTPSTTSQELLQSVSDSVDDDSSDSSITAQAADFTAATTASQTIVADALQTGTTGWYAFTDSLTATASPTAVGRKRQDPDLTAAATSPSATPVALNSSGPSTSTASSPYQSTSNVTLIFTPVNPAVQTNEIIQPNDDSTDAQQATMASKRGYYGEDANEAYGDGSYEEPTQQYAQEDPSYYSEAPSSEYPRVSPATFYPYQSLLSQPVSAPHVTTAPYHWTWTADFSDGDSDASAAAHSPESDAAAQSAPTDGYTSAQGQPDDTDSVLVSK
ncbi:hypothetical protein P7C73_g4424, partial [Tremellales sp. Uapishka_1]